MPAMSTMTSSPISQYITLNEAAEIIGVSPQQAWRYIHNLGQASLPAVRFGTVWMVRRKDAERFKRIPVGNPAFRNQGKKKR